MALAPRSCFSLAVWYVLPIPGSSTITTGELKHRPVFTVGLDFGPGGPFPQLSLAGQSCFWVALDVKTMLVVRH